jgi:hypothetical protein
MLGSTARTAAMIAYESDRILIQSRTLRWRVTPGERRSAQPFLVVLWMDAFSLTFGAWDICRNDASADAPRFEVRVMLNRGGSTCLR